MRNFDFDKVESALGYKFGNRDLLLEAFTHSTYAYENHLKSYERMEFLGDSVLGFVISEELYGDHDNYEEGALSRIRANIVSKVPLAVVSKKLGLDKYLLSGGSVTKYSDKILSSIFESAVAAIYLDGGMENAKKFILDKLKDTIADNSTVIQDAKSALYEFAQAKRWNVSFVMDGEEGPDNDKVFFCSVKINGKSMASGKGKSKNDAEQDASNLALQKLKKQ